MIVGNLQDTKDLQALKQLQAHTLLPVPQPVTWLDGYIPAVASECRGEDVSKVASIRDTAAIGRAKGRGEPWSGKGEWEAPCIMTLTCHQRGFLGACKNRRHGCLP